MKAMIPQASLGPMDRVPLASSSLASAAYAASARRLELRFQSGASYEYYDVPREVFAALLEAESKGRYFNEAVRGRFDYRRV